MKTALPLIALLAILAGGVIWKTQFAVPSSSDAELSPRTGGMNYGIVTVGVAPDDEAEKPAPNPVSAQPATAPPSTDTQPKAEMASGEPSKPQVVPAVVKEAPTPPAAPQPSLWIVQSGDTLMRIARNAYTSNGEKGRVTPELIEAIAVANKLDDPGSIQVSQKLILPVVSGFQAPRGN